MLGEIEDWIQQVISEEVQGGIPGGDLEEPVQSIIAAVETAVLLEQQMKIGSIDLAK